MTDWILAGPTSSRISEFRNLSVFATPQHG
jgi:hypothetical protein